MGLLVSLKNRFGGFFTWWFSELAGCLPDRLRGLFGRNSRKLWITVAGDSVAFDRVKGAAVQRLGTLDLVQAGFAGPAERAREILSRGKVGQAEVVIRLPRDRSLRHTIDLPSPALENLREVLTFEMDRHTPFKAEEVYFDSLVTAHDSQNKRIKVDLVVVTREIADRAIDLVTGWGVRPDRLALAGAPDQDEGFNLLPAMADAPKRRTPLRLSAVLVLATCVAMAGAVYVPLTQKRADLRRIEARLQQVRAEATAVDKLNKQFEQMIERSRFVVQQKRTRYTVTELLNEVTLLLPDNTWLLQFARKGENLTISGYSDKASALIGLVEESDVLSKVSFRSPVTRDPRVDRERFNISATVLQRGEE
jgi:general secretion pathway protein L